MWAHIRPLVCGRLAVSSELAGWLAGVKEVEPVCLGPAAAAAESATFFSSVIGATGRGASSVAAGSVQEQQANKPTGMGRQMEPSGE